MPWISLPDELAAIEYLLTADVAGPVNLSGPAPARNSEFARTLGRLLHRPALLPAPRFALRVGLGEFADEALASLRVRPRAAGQAGFQLHPRRPGVGAALSATGGLSRHAGWAWAPDALGTVRSCPSPRRVAPARAGRRREPAATRAGVARTRWSRWSAWPARSS